MSRVIIITGTRKGLGFQLCEYFLAEGDIVYGCSRRESSIEHERYTHFRLDVSDEKSVVDMVRQIYKTHKRISTDLIKNVPEEKIQELIERQSIKRLGRFEDVLNVINFYISPESEFVTGQVLYLGGIN